MKKHIVTIIFIFILIFAFLLRSKMVLHGDFYYLLDQSRDLLLAKSIVVDHKLTLIGARTGLGGLFHGPLWIYMIVPFFILAKGNPFFTLVPLFEIVNLSIIIIGFFVGKKLYGKWMGLLFALFFTLTGPLAFGVPNISNAQMLPVIFLLYLYAIMQFIRGKEKYIILALFFTGLGFQFESAFAILLFPLTILAIFLRKKLPTIPNILWSIGVFLLGVATFILFDIKHKFLMTSSALKLFTNHVKPLPGYEQYTNIGFRIQDRIVNLWITLFTPLYANNLISTILLITILVLGIWCLIQAKKTTKKKKPINTLEKEYLFILLSPIIIFGIYVFYPLPLWPHYLLPTSILAVFILVLSIQTIWTKKEYKILVSIFVILAIFPALTSIKRDYFDAPQYQSVGDGTYKNQLPVAKWILNDTKNKEYGYFVYTPGILTYNMDYLLWWISHTEHISTPSNVKHPTTYLILYPHITNDANAYAFWKKYVVRTNGKIIVSKTFDGKITIEKLHLEKTEQAADANYYQNLLFR